MEVLKMVGLVAVVAVVAGIAAGIGMWLFFAAMVWWFG